MKFKDLEKYCRDDGHYSMMRLGFNRLIVAAIIIAILLSVGSVLGFIIAIIKGTDLQSLSACIGALSTLGLTIIGAILVPAVGGKVSQAKFEIADQNPEPPEANQ